ncbi:MAG: hypothetical protein H8E46_00780, partial [FCB group bacterium]|nr:hypothetical protein [FCB group bacterium]
MRRLITLLILSLSLAAVISGCGDDDSRNGKPDGRITVFVSIAPQAYLV